MGLRDLPFPKKLFHLHCMLSYITFDIELYHFAWVINRLEFCSDTRFALLMYAYLVTHKFGHMVILYNNAI